MFAAGKTGENGNPQATTPASIAANAKGFTPRDKMTGDERRSYIKAVRCLMNRPSQYRDHDLYPGAQTRFDDFVAQHINITFIHHGTFSFLAFHRYFLWAYETELRESCGYEGAQPVGQKCP